MARMVKYNDKYISMAYGLVNAKSTDDEIKAAEDLYVIELKFRNLVCRFWFSKN